VTDYHCKLPDLILAARMRIEVTHYLFRFRFLAFAIPYRASSFLVARFCFLGTAILDQKWCHPEL
jgi:hypothetical protein